MKIMQSWKLPPRTEEELWRWKFYVAIQDEINAKSPVHIMLSWVEEFTVEDPCVQRAINIWIMRKRALVVSVPNDLRR